MDQVDAFVGTLSLMRIEQLKRFVSELGPAPERLLEFLAAISGGSAPPAP
jgi:hypothetical protein